MIKSILNLPANPDPYTMTLIGVIVLSMLVIMGVFALKTIKELRK